MSPFNCPSLFTILSLSGIRLTACGTPSAGATRSVKAWPSVAERTRGRSPHLDEAVTELLFDGRKAVGVKHRTGRIPGRRRHPQRRLRPVNDKSSIPNKQFASRWTDEKLATKRYSCSTFMMYLGIEGRYDHLNHHTIYTSGDYVGNLADIETQLQALATTRPFYVQNAGIHGRHSRPAEGHEYACTCSPPCRTCRTIRLDWESREAALPRRLVLQVNSPKVGMGDLEVSHPLREDRHDPGRLGGTTTKSTAGRRSTSRTTSGRCCTCGRATGLTEFGNMYLVGGGTHPGSGLPVIYESARITTRLLLQDFGTKMSTWLGKPGAADEDFPARPVASKSVNQELHPGLS